VAKVKPLRRRARSIVLCALSISAVLLLQFGQSVSASATPILNQRAAQAARPLQHAFAASKVITTPALRPVPQNTANYVVTTTPITLPPCHKTQHHITSPRGRVTYLATFGCPTIDTSRLGHAPMRAPKKIGTVPAGTAAPTVATPPSICPPALSPNITRERFKLCMHVPMSIKVVLTYTYSDGSKQTFQFLLKYEIEMWAELTNNQREWNVTANVKTTQPIPALPAPIVIPQTVFFDCTDLHCDITNPVSLASLGNYTGDGTTIQLQEHMRDITTTATQSFDNILVIKTSTVGWTPTSSGELDAQFGTIDKPNPLRCDNQINQPAYINGGCVDRYSPSIWEVSDKQYPTMDLVVKHMAAMSCQLPGYTGLANCPGKQHGGTPFTYNPAKQAVNRAKACGGQVPPPGTPSTYDTCDEYPLASTDQGAAAPGAIWDICWVPKAANDSQGGTLISALVSPNRVLPGDPFYIHATYYGNTQGCDNGLQSGGSATADNPLDGMFSSYGDSATCAGWSGGDATNSVDLGGGYRAWFFSDSFLNSPEARKTIWYRSTVHNSIVIQSGSQPAFTITGGNTCQETNLGLDFWSRYAKTPAAAPDAGGGYWTGDQMVVGPAGAQDVVKFYYHVGAGFNIDHPAVATIPVSSLESPARDASGNPMITIAPTQFSCGASNIIWGTALLNWNGNIYVYGWQATGPRNIYLAKTTTANLASPSTWQVYDGLNGSNQPMWGTCNTSPVALPISNGTSGFSVDFVNNSLWLVQFDYTNGQLAAAGAIGAHPSATPWGFGNKTVALYSPPTGFVSYPYYYQDYEARIQPGLGAAGQVVISYNVNTSAVDTGCVSANNHDATIYRPRFIDVPVSDFNPSLAVPAPGTSTPAARNATARTPTGIPGAASHGFPYGIHNSRPPFAIPRYLPVPLPPPASATPAPGRSGSVKPASASMSAAAGGIDGATDWFPGPNCPVIAAPAPPALTAQSLGVVGATWTNVGTDVWYYVWICDQTKNGCSVEGKTSPWFPAWPYSTSLSGVTTYLWTTVPSAELDPIGAVFAGTGQNGSGDTFAIYVSPFGAGNGNCSANPGCGGSPEATIKVSS
jgi:hypothetical protein